jgi:hypothetical protein
MDNLAWLCLLALDQSMLGRRLPTIITLRKSLLPHNLDTLLTGTGHSPRIINKSVAVVRGTAVVY